MSDKKIKEKKTTKKKLIITIIVICSILVVLALVAFVGPLIFEKYMTSNEESERIFFYPADYDIDPYADPKYMLQIRDVYFLEGNTGVLVTDDTRNTIRDTAVFFEEYFNLAIEGKYEEYQELFDKSLYNGLDIPEKFTGQKIYDIEVEFYQELSDSANDKVTYEYYIVRYKIMYNNGTFRNDIGSNETRPLMYTIKKEGDSNKIVGIEKIKFVYTD